MGRRTLAIDREVAQRIFAQHSALQGSIVVIKCEVADHASRGTFAARPDDGLQLINASITNAVRCVPPENKPVGGEISNCRRFLTPTIEQFANLRAIVTLGTIAHQSTIRAFGKPVAKFPFSHGGQSDIGNIRIFSSYHCSRYNTNTGRLTTEMFRSVFAEVRRYLDDISR